MKYTKTTPSLFDKYVERQAVIRAIRAQNAYAIRHAKRIEILLACQSLKTKPYNLRFEKYKCVA